MQKFDQNLYREQYKIQSNRIPGYDYSQPGYYSITICTKNMVEYFGDVINKKMVLNKYGRIAQQNLLLIHKYDKNIILDEFVVMPNHIHVILQIVGNVIADLNGVHRRDVACNVSTVVYKNHYARISPKRGSLSVIVRSFKSTCTKQIHDMGLHDFVWQSNYYDHIIRNAKSLHEIREYIKNNPINWDNDRNNIY